MKTIYDIIIAPVITEESMAMGAEKKYVFKVMPNATKPEIAEAVEAMFKVDVKCVNTINVKKQKPFCHTILICHIFSPFYSNLEISPIYLLYHICSQNTMLFIKVISFINYVNFSRLKMGDSCFIFY